MARSLRPLDRVGSIKLKLGILIVAAVALSTVVSVVGYRLGLPVWLRPVIAAAFALGLVQVLARGMTSPLREMAAAARAMADGDWSRPVTTSSADEVGDLARAFSSMAADLAAFDRARTDLLANVSHELRTPLAALRARLENLVDEVERPTPEIMSAMLAQTERLGRLVDQLLDLSRLESGSVPLHRSTVSVADLVDGVVQAARLAHPDRALRVDVSVGLTVDADADRLYDVMANLVANGLRHGPPGSPVTVGGRRLPTAVELWVADEGDGIAPDEAERVFERFYRSESAPAGGSGLGLSIARWIVELHGGEIRPESDAGRGCTMVVRIPDRGEMHASQHR